MEEEETKEEEKAERQRREKQFVRLEHLSDEKNMGQLFDRLLLEVIRLADARRSARREEHSSVDQ